MKSIWRQFQQPSTKPDNDNGSSPITTDPVLKSTRRTKLSPTIDVITHPSEESIGGSQQSQGSLLDLSMDFIESNDSLNKVDQKQLAFNQSMENLPTDLLSASLTSLDLSVNHRNEYQGKWPIPDSISQVHTFCEKEQLEGNSNSRLALFLHLMESAWQVDPNHQIEQQDRSHRKLDEIMATLHITPGPSHVPTTLREALVYEAKKLLKQLAQSSSQVTDNKGAEAEAQYLLGNCYGMGALGWSVNHKRAFQCYVQASKHGHPEATYRAAACYEMGIGTTRDGPCAITFYRKAAHLLYVPAMYKLGVILMRGYCDSPISKREAIVWLQRAACTAIAPLAPEHRSNATTIGGHGGVALPHALHALAIVHLTRECERTSMIPDVKYAFRLLHNAARLGYAPSQSKLGEYYECGYFCPEDEYQSIYWYTLAAQQDYPEACLAMSGWYLTGSIKTDMIAQSDKDAYLWARKAAKLAKRVEPKSLTAKAYYTMGIYHEHGIGVPKSLDASKQWYQKAAQYGHPIPSSMHT